MATFFAKISPNFSPPDENGNIDTETFLKAGKQIVPIFDVLGTAFMPVKSDVEGNITRLSKKYNSDQEKFHFLKAILEDELERKCAQDKYSSTQALLWFKRTLEYITLFLQILIEDHKSGTKTENMGPFIRRAYDETLKKYHGWLVQKVFSVVSRAAPWRKDFLKALAGGQDDFEDEVISDMEQYIRQVRVTIASVHNMLTELDLDFQDKV
ncbi:hypothetical protein LSH36_236g02033 [Paralvinella palmiformis]|uniref:Glycolipid transfer protein domain-containing protein n=1 Tax=Paralvinella palmiformis TaxID=53620 RepID=A0AAD9JP56_9ANNE|nr:hypothetical protein LSH36_236g02033 [Paralvinella palmiformis]